MYFKVEPTGCCEYKGMVQVRFSFYLDPVDEGYEKHHVQLPIIPPEGYTGPVDENGEPIEPDYTNWLNSLPKAWYNNPFYNHFYLFEPDVTLTEVIAKSKALLNIVGERWLAGSAIYIKNPQVIYPERTSARIALCEAKVASIKIANIEGR